MIPCPSILHVYGACIHPAGHAGNHRPNPLKRPCPVPGCTSITKPNKLMCWPHWNRVPKVIRTAVFETYNAAGGKKTVHYCQAADSAIAAVAAKEGNKVEPAHGFMAVFHPEYKETPPS